MAFPFFYLEKLTANDSQVTLDEATSRHMVQVLRMKAGEQVQLTNGKGLLAIASLTAADKKTCTVSVESSKMVARPASRRVAIGISPVKNTSRFEWFLEKATELGVHEIFPLLCQRTVKEHFRQERMNTICISAMLQSQQAWLPLLHPPVTYSNFITSAPGEYHYHQKWIAHCDDFEKHSLVKVVQPTMKDSLLLIGPEGDFTPQEIMDASVAGFSAVTLGETRLRTETAGVVAATILMLC
jgi:16S rRNA (uracil1498-N3)-methyltransferase